MMKEELTLDDLVLDGRKIWQLKDGFRLGLDSVLLSFFAGVSTGDMVADLGTGVGVLPLLITALTREVKFYAVEIQKELAVLAEKNINLNNIGNSITIFQGDLREIDKKWGTGHFDYVVTNPPYRKTGTGRKSLSSSKRIATEEVFCNLGQVLNMSAKLLRPGGKVALVHKSDRLTEIIDQCMDNQLQPIRLRFVHALVNEKANMVLVEGEKQSKRQLTIEPPLIIYGKNGEYVKELQEIFKEGR